MIIYVAKNGIITFIRRGLSPNLELTFNQLSSSPYLAPSYYDSLKLWLQLSRDSMKELNLYFAKSTPIIEITVSTDGRIEDQVNSLQVDFANMWIGGGVLDQGCVQEEIRMLIAPELILSLSFAARLEDRESVVMLGSERIANYEGYGRDFKYGGNFVDLNSHVSQIVAIDAVKYTYMDKHAQYSPEFILRELNKALAGFLPISYGFTDLNHLSKLGSISHNPIATGNWGAGAFSGNAELKCIIQWISASLCMRPCMQYFTFNSPNVDSELLLKLENIRKMQIQNGKPWTVSMNKFSIVF